MSDPLDKLRDEIIAGQNAKRDLQKWKVALSGGAAAAALGFTGSNVPNAHLAACIVPLVVAYADILIRDADLRIALKSYFMSTQGEHCYAEYERYIRKPEVDYVGMWEFDNNGNRLSSLAICWFVIAFGIVYIAAKDWTGAFLVISAIAGLKMVGEIDRLYQLRHTKLRELLSLDTQPCSKDETTPASFPNV